MVCFKPQKAHRKKGGGVTFVRNTAWVDRPITLPCGQCIGCRLEKSRQWAIRCVHEASLWEQNSFITLTYNDEHLPRDWSLDQSHFQKFMKRLRKRYGANIRVYYCGEYGENFGRPHFHACLFNYDFNDKKLWKVSDRGDHLYRSQSLEELWPFGYSSVGELTFESAAYTARYILKKVTGEQAETHYLFTDPITGEVHARKPEFTNMSRRPGIGKGWFDKYKDDVYPHDFIVIRGKKMAAPKYYDRQYELLYPSEMQQVKAVRKRATRTHSDNNTTDRLKVRESVQASKLKQLTRKLK